MKAEIAKLTATGGGDSPEMCLSGLQLALTGAPASSHIYVFTDAVAKDFTLKDTIVALIRSTKSTVSFFITDGGVGRRRRKRSEGTFDTYKELALASGGQAIRVTKANLPQATDIIADSSTSALVTVLQRARNPGKVETFSFQLDKSLTNITIYITGSTPAFTLKNPAGVTQTQTEANGKLGTVQIVGNFYRIRLASNQETGLWEININSAQPYTLKVTGQSTIAFIYDFVESFGGPHPGYAPISGRPESGVPATLLVSVLGKKGPASFKVSNVALVTVSGSEVVGGALEDMGNGDFLVTVTKVPAGEFVVLLNGTDLVSSTLFQRQSTTQMSVSSVAIFAVVDRTMEPGNDFSLPFTVMSNAIGGTYTINAKIDKDFKMNFPKSITVVAGGNATANLTITAPPNTNSGTDITLTIEAVAPGSIDSNYAILRLSVVTKVTDFTPPQCEVVSVSQVDCPANPVFCNASFWHLSANLTDGVNGTGIASFKSRQGIGSLNYTDLNQAVVTANFTASCCSLIVELVAVDKAMNVGTCLHSIVRSLGPPSLTLTLPLSVYSNNLQWKEGAPATVQQRLMMSPIVGVSLLALVLSGGAWAFVPRGGGASSHVSMTQKAVLQKITQVCRPIAGSEGQDFILTGDSAEELVQACLGPTAIGEVSAAKFKTALNEINDQHSLVDRDFVDSPEHHFNSEMFNQGRGLITEGMASIKVNVRAGNFLAARKTLGRVLHTLQDFYSHSNWVDMGYTQPYLNLIRPDLPLENLADRNTPTCKDWTNGGFCPNTILPDILNKKKLTSGYMGIYSRAKPTGKCSHGGAADLTSLEVPRGGISKDERRADNVALHNTAVTVATTASLQLLDDIRGAAGDKDFLRFMGIARSSVVAFVIDTTGSMRDEIAEAKRVVNNIIDGKKGTQDEPSEYILVPFNDPKFGPLIRTTDPDVMKAEIAKLTATGGGDLPEMCLSGLQLALTGAPTSSHIYVFTDAVAKDFALKDTIIALIRSTKSTVSFFMTGDGAGARRRKRAVGTFDTYKDLALASGGQAIGVSKANLPQATDIIADSSTSALVTVLQRARNPGKAETFSFQLDKSLTNITIYITGKTLTFTLKNPLGVTQTQTEANGKLGTVQIVGNFYRIRLASNQQTGLWEINMNSNQPYTIKVTGQSTIAFIYDFVESFGGPHPGYAPISGRPKSGVPATLLVSVLGRKGPASFKVSDVALVTVSGSEVVGGTQEDMGNGDFLVTVTEVPAGEFVVLLNGTDLVSSTLFQRQSTTQMSVSKVTIEAVVDRTMEPGNDFSLPFTVMSDGAGGTYTINARNDKDFTMNFPKSIILVAGGNATANLTITAPPNTNSGTDITLTIEAVAPGSIDSNYAILRLSVVTKVTDFTPPQCEVVSVSAVDCPANPVFCNASFWQLSANLTDGVNGTGIASIIDRQGIGSLNYTDLNQTVVTANFNASCCSLIVELVAVDKVMNVGTCLHSIAPVITSTSAPSTATSTTPSAGPPSLTLTLPLWVCLLVPALFTSPFRSN
ncbi:hypothetical protein DPEC_G00182050 [Dallia pectoralis]|uniref:Uncharacterized protein n=1 Tax=Dallia pectoralis TaxID=75939 RepID=A0ACC2GA97_DALPE|nr:hypothetical protein DPEC_G00182050 [Dallia pectoralis]